jgi:hypothetical protein
VRRRLVGALSAYYYLPINSRRRSSKCRNNRTKNLATTDASEGASNGISGWTQIDVLHAGSSGISSECSGNELDNQIDIGAGHVFIPRADARKSAGVYLRRRDEIEPASIPLSELASFCGSQITGVWAL